MQPEVHAEMAAVQQRHWWFCARRRILQRLIESLRLPPQARILDSGCGSGGNLAMLSRFGRLQAMEVDATAREAAASLGICPVAAGCLPHQLPFDGERYDLICLLDVLEHVDDDGAALVQLARRLNPGGRVLVTVPAYAWLWSAHDVAHHHRRRYTASGLRQLAEQNGLVVQRLGYFNALLFPAIAAARLLGRWRCQGGASDAALPSAPVNALLQAVFAFERHLVPRRLFPAGTSVLAVLRLAA